MANRGKMRQIADVKRSKIVVEIGVFYYPLPCVTLGDLECRGFEAGRQTGICARAIKPEIGFHVRFDVVSAVMPLKQVVLHIGSVLPQQLKQLFAGAIELPLVFFSIVQEYLQIIENRLFRNGNRIVFQPHRFICEIALVFVCVGQVNGRHMSTDFGKQFPVSQPYT